MFLKQISIFVENQPGGLAVITSHLAKGNIDLRALSIADTADYGILRIIVDNTDKAMDVLGSHGIMCSVTEVIAAKIPDVPGSLSRVLELLSAEGIGVEYVYAFLANDKDNAYVVIRVEDENNEKAANILVSNGIAAAVDGELFKQD